MREFGEILADLASIEIAGDEKQRFNKLLGELAVAHNNKQTTELRGYVVLEEGQSLDLNLSNSTGYIGMDRTLAGIKGRYKRRSKIWKHNYDIYPLMVNINVKPIATIKQGEYEEA